MTENARLKAHFQMASEKGMSQGMFDLDIKVRRPTGGRGLRGSCTRACAGTCGGRKLSTMDCGRAPAHEPSRRRVAPTPQGSDWNGQLKWGTSNFFGANYFQSVTPHLALGGELFYLAEQRRSGIGLAARHATERSVSTLQAANTGLLSMTYLQKVNDKARCGGWQRRG